MKANAREIAALIGGTVEGDPQVLVSQPAKIEEAGPGEMTFLGNPKYEDHIYRTKASIVLVHEKFVPSKPVTATLIRVKDVYSALSELLSHFQVPVSNGTKGAIDPLAFVHPQATVEPGATISKFCVVEKGALIRSEAYLMPQVYVGADAQIGNGTLLHPGVRVLTKCTVGNQCIIHANTVIGSDGFGFAPTPEGGYKKIPHVGDVIIDDDVEIGANCAIDRASMGHTRIRKGAKLDNLIHIAHGVEVGEHTVIAAQVGVAGSTTIGAHAQIGGQVGIVGHIKLADGTKIQAQSGVSSNIETPNTALFGSPAIPYTDYLRSYTVFKRLPELERELHRLKKELDELKREG